MMINKNKRTENIVIL